MAQGRSPSGKFSGGIGVDDTNTETSFTQRSYMQSDKKRRIGKKAAELVHNGEAIFLGTGSTALEVAKNLTTRRNLTVITSSLPVITTLVDSPGVDLVVTGGALRRPELSFIGHIVEKAGAVKLPCGERERPSPRGLSSCCDCLAPRVHRRGAKRAVCLS